MREEAERVVQRGVDQEALGKMHKIDSFLRESQRLNSMASVTMTRKCVAPEGFTFFGRGAHSLRILRQRFLARRAIRLQYTPPNRLMVTTWTDHLAFGHGHHVGPGRFFTATELKAMLAHVLLSYDVWAETEGVRPRMIALGR
ncbi:hypothetical protein DFH09DRAFT_1317927 [Mycena vulgaris]|nr:hypothetical protein DFH09DRAFT_1317927 [Mycena vulgaris]